jgi:hypothetical protein
MLYNIIYIYYIMKQIYKIACLICIIVIVIYLKPNTFGLGKFINNLSIPRLNNNTNNKSLINIVCSFISSLNNTNFDYQNIIEQKFYIKPKTNNKYITKIVNNFINKTFIIKNVYIHNVKITEPIEYYEINNGIYIPNIKFKMEIISDLLNDYTYKLDIAMDLFVISHTNITILGIKTENIILITENKENDFNSVFIKMPDNNNILDYEEDSLIPTIAIDDI